jgi:hypothetical protein
LENHQIKLAVNATFLKGEYTKSLLLFQNSILVLGKGNTMSPNNNCCYYEFQNITLENGYESKRFEVSKIEDKAELDIEPVSNLFLYFFTKFKAIHMSYCYTK